MKLQIQFEGEYQISLSTRVTNPTPQNCEESFSSLKNYQLFANKVGSTSQKEVQKDPFDCTDKVRIVEWFSDKYLYFGIKSMRGCSLILSILQSKPRSNHNKVKLEKYKAQQERLFNTINSYFTPDEPYYRDMLEMVRQEKELANRHKKLLMEFGPVKLFQKDEEKLLEKWREVHLKRFNNHAAKQSMDEAEFKRKYFLLYKWEMLGRLKEKMLNEQSDCVRHGKYSKNFVVKYKLREILIKLNQIFIKRREAKVKKRKMFVMKSKFRMRMHESLLAKGPTLDERIRSNFQHLILFMCGSRFSNQQFCA